MTFTSPILSKDGTWKTGTVSARATSWPCAVGWIWSGIGRQMGVGMGWLFLFSDLSSSQMLQMCGLFTSIYLHERWKLATWTKGKWLGKYSIYMVQRVQPPVAAHRFKFVCLGRNIGNVCCFLVLGRNKQIQIRNPKLINPSSLLIQYVWRDLHFAMARYLNRQFVQGLDELDVRFRRMWLRWSDGILPDGTISATLVQEGVGNDQPTHLQKLYRMYVYIYLFTHTYYNIYECILWYYIIMHNM